MLARELSVLADAFMANRAGIERFLQRKTGCKEAGRDLAQETWLRVQQATPAQPVDNPVAYLFRLATNLAVDWQRQEQARTHHVQPAAQAVEAVPSPEPSAEDALQARTEYEALCAAIRGLPPKCQEVFLLYRSQGLSMRQVAVRLDISEKTVENHLAKAMLHCRLRVRAAGRAV